MTGGDAEICVARFTRDGILERPPVCNTRTLLGELSESAARIAAGDEGLAVVVMGTAPWDLFFLRTDLTGVAVGELYEILRCGGPREPADCEALFGAYNTVWAERGFGVLFSGRFRLPGIDGPALLLQTFVAE